MYRAESTKIHANAKVNLALRITGRRADGYHRISSVFQQIDAHDTLFFTAADNYQLTCSNAALPCGESNLCTRAYRALEKRYADHQQWQIHLEKNVPLGSGLGGGSADAAAVLVFLNRAWQLQLSEPELLKIAATIGSDVPFFIRGKTQGVEGIGDILRPLQLPTRPLFLLVCPAVAISTAWAYRQFDLTKRKDGYKFNDLFEGNKIHYELFENQFESVVFPAYPEIGRIKTTLLAQGAVHAGLSGSGSTVFGIFQEKETAEVARSYFAAYQTFLSLPIL